MWVIAFAAPLSVLLLLTVGGYELRKRRRAQLGKKMLSATSVDEVMAFLYPTRRMELDHRDSMSMLRDDDAQGAPPREDIDLDRGIVRLRVGNS